MSQIILGNRQIQQEASESHINLPAEWEQSSLPLSRLEKSVNFSLLNHRFYASGFHKLKVYILAVLLFVVCQASDFVLHVPKARVCQDSSYEAVLLSWTKKHVL